MINDPEIVIARAVFADSTTLKGAPTAQTLEEVLADYCALLLRRDAEALAVSIARVSDHLSDNLPDDALGEI